MKIRMTTNYKTAKTQDELEKELKQDVENFINELFPEYHNHLPEEFRQNIIVDVMECSAFEDGYYNESDIQLAFEREIASRYGVEI